MRPDTFTLALTFTFCCILAFKWFYFRNESFGNNLAKIRFYYEQSLSRLAADPNNPLLLDKCYQLGHQLYDRTLIGEDVKVMSQLARLRIERDIEKKLIELEDEAA